MSKYELSHDILANEVYEMISLEEKELIKSKKSLTNRLEDYENDRADLLNRKELIYFERILKKLHLSEELEEFIDKSRKKVKETRDEDRKNARELADAQNAKIIAQEKEAKAQKIIIENQQNSARKRRVLLIVQTVLFVIAVGIANYAIKQEAKAKEKETEAVRLNKALKENEKNLRASKGDLTDVLNELESANNSLKQFKSLNIDSVLMKTNHDSVVSNSTQKIIEYSKFQLGIAVESNEEEYQDLLDFVYNSGFKVRYLNKKPTISEEPVIYYYSDAGEEIAFNLRQDLLDKFPNVLEIKPHRLIRGESNEIPTFIIAKLRFKKE